MFRKLLSYFKELYYKKKLQKQGYNIPKFCDVKPSYHYYKKRCWPLNVKEVERLGQKACFLYCPILDEVGRTYLERPRKK